MKTVKPSYYDNFICIADKCPYTCCQEWDISVDSKTASEWRKMQSPGTGTGLLSGCVKYGKGECTLKLNNEKKCFQLDEDGLCKVVLAYGEDKIPETCHVFPREEAFFSSRTEMALSPACPYVLDLLWKEDSYRLEEASEDEDSAADPMEEAAFLIRDWFMELMEQRNESAGSMLRVFFCILRDMREITGRDKSSFTPDFVKAYIKATNVPEVFATLTSEVEGDSALSARFRENNEIFLDIVNRYVKQRKYERLLKLVVPFAEHMSSEEYKNIDKYLDAHKYCSSKFEKLLRLLVWEEIGSSLISNLDVESMLLKLEWIILEYIAVKQAVFLRWYERRELSYEEFRETVTVINRITGYTDGDIRQFMKTEFESLIWPLDYGFLVL